MPFKNNDYLIPYIEEEYDNSLKENKEIDIIEISTEENDNAKILNLYNEEKILFQNIKNLYTNKKYYEAIIRALSNTDSITKALDFQYLLNLPHKFIKEKREIEENKLDILLKKLFIDLYTSIEDSILIRILLNIKDKKFVREQLLANKKKIVKILNHCQICSPTKNSIDDYDDGWYIGTREIITVYMDNQNLKEFIKCLFLEINYDNFDIYNFNHLLYNENKKNIYNAKREITPFLKNIVKKYKKINVDFLRSIIEVDSVKELLDGVTILGNPKQIIADISIRHNNPIMIEKRNNIVKILESVKPTIEDKNKHFPNSFFYQLKQLRNKYQETKNIKDLKELEEYICCKNAFKYIIKKNLKITNNDYEKVLDQLFHKIIKKENFFNIYQITSIKELTHYNRTKNNKININKFTNEDLETYSIRQYNKLYKGNNEKTKDKEDYDNILKLLLIFKYEHARKLLSVYSLHELSQLLDGINTSQENYLKDNKEYLDYLLDNNKIFNKKNSFLLSAKEDYNYAKLIFQKIPTPEQVKIIKESEEINIPPLANPLTPYLLLLSNKDIKKAIAKSINIYYKYQDRIISTIPDICGRYDNLTYKTIDMQDPKALFLGEEIGCCLTPAGKAEIDLEHALINQDGRLFGVFKNDKIIALSWIWRNNGLLCFDNIEVRKENLKNGHLGNKLLNIYVEAANTFYTISKKEEAESERITTVTLGRNKVDIQIPNLKKQIELKEDKLKKYTPKNYKNNLYLNDSQNKQFILIKEEKDPLSQNNTTKHYLRARNKPVSFNDKNAYDLKKQIDYIRSKAQLPLNDETGYISGIINDDYYIGITSKFELEIVSYENDRRKKEELEIELKKMKKILLDYKKSEKEYFKKEKELSQAKYETSFKDFITQETKEKSIELNIEDYYHGTSIKNLISILDQKQIACKFRCQNRIKGPLNRGYNQAFHICVTKYCQSNNHLFEMYVKNSIAFVLNKNLPTTIRTNKGRKNANDFRWCGHKNEFQVKDTIPLSEFKAISIPMRESADLERARIISDALDTFQINLPIIDITNKKILPKELINKYTKRK